MFNNKAIQNQNAALLQQQQNRSETCFQNGMQALLSAHEQGFADPLPSRKACELLIEAIRLNRQDIRAYLMLAYLFAIFADFPRAWQYLDAAQEIAPHHAELLHFRQQMQFWQQGGTVSTATGRLEADAPQAELPAASLPVSATPPETEVDQEYLALEGRLKTRIHQLERQVCPAVSANPVQLAEMEENSQRFHEQQQRLAVRIETLADSHDTGGLYKLLQQLDSLWEPQEKTLRQSRVLTALKAQIQQTQLNVLDLLYQSAVARTLADIQRLEKELEVLLDQCDALTHILETLIRHQVQVDEVEPVYKNLLGQAELFRENLDERLAAIPE